MAKVTVTFEDLDDGVGVQIASDPPFPSDSDKCSDAQEMAFSMMYLLQQKQEESEAECCGHDCCNHEHQHASHEPEVQPQSDNKG